MIATPAITVALVEDDESCRRATVRLFRAHGMMARAFESAEAFLNGRQAFRPDCLVLDIQLAGMSGIELQSRLVREGSKLPIIFLTALEGRTYHGMARCNGCDAFLSKTEPADTLLAAIRRAVGRLP